jgi:hypothetical protein
MNTRQFQICIAVLCCALILSSCKKDKCTQTVTYATYVPVYMSYADMRNGVKIGPAQPLKNPGKIYLKGNYIFANELNQGIHVIDNTNPSSPQNIAFIAIPGNVDMATNGNTLYADSYIDLLSFNISSISNITLVNRLQSALPYNCSSNGYSADSSQGVVTNWQKKMVTQKVSDNCNAQQPIMYDMFNGFSPTANSTTTTGNYGSTNVPGIGGSTARITVASNTLYIVDNSTLHLYDVTNTSLPQHVNDQNIGWAIETIFPYNNNLFIGSDAGFYIYDITNPQSPAFISEYSHITACDPVTVDNHYAYFTLSGDAPCHKNVNELDIVDISNLSNPTLVTTVSMTDPKGVGVDAQTLFVCDTKDGLKVYNTANINAISMIAHFSNINAFDVIPFNKHLVMSGSNGLYQYDYSNLQSITLLSSIPVVSTN